MAARYDNVEKAMGIEAYASPDAPGFAAVSKARYSDFVVHEVDVDGNVSRLESLENNLWVSRMAKVSAHVAPSVTLQAVSLHYTCSQLWIILQLFFK